jgi:nucleotide-binding universal stress UspA family protein
MFEKILVAIDGSTYSYKALSDAIEIAKMASAKISLIHVYVPGSTFSRSTRRPFYELLKEEGDKIIENGKAIAKNEGLDVETLLIEGDPVEQIVKVAKDGQFDLVVIGARGVGKVTALLLGSVSQGVANNVHCRVLITKCP